MPRYRLTLEYDGSGYNGFQAQLDQPTVQGTVETAIAAFCGQTVRLAAAGRTDTGVHATGQVISFDLDKAWPERTVSRMLVPSSFSVATPIQYVFFHVPPRAASP